MGAYVIHSWMVANKIMNTRHKANWKINKDRKQRLINRGNERGNKNRKDHTYRVGEKVLLKNE